MAPRPYPSSSYSLELDFQPGSGDDASPPEADASHPEEIPHALQNDHARTPAAASGAPPGTRQQQDIASDLGSLRGRSESPARQLDADAEPGAARERAEPDRERSQGARAAGPAGRFASRIRAERQHSGPSLSRRGDGIYPPSHATRLAASRAATGVPSPASPIQESLFPFSVSADARDPATGSRVPQAEHDTTALGPALRAEPSAVTASVLAWQSPATCGGFG